GLAETSNALVTLPGAGMMGGPGGIRMGGPGGLPGAPGGMPGMPGAPGGMPGMPPGGGGMPGGGFGMRGWGPWGPAPGPPGGLHRPAATPPALPADDGTAVRVAAVPAARLFPGAAPGEARLALQVTPEPRLRWQRLVGLRVDRAVDDRGQVLSRVKRPAA